VIRADSFVMPIPGEEAKYKLEQCVRCKFYGCCELIDGYELFKKNHPKADVLSYNSKDCPMKQAYGQIECGNKYVNDGIGDHYKINILPACYDYKIEEESDTQIIDKSIDRWEPTQTVFISAQTGRGKNHFIENTLLPYVRELNLKNITNQKVLILSNRIALRLQINDRLKQGISSNDYDEDIMLSMGDFADVMMYQGILNKVDYLKSIQKSKDKSYIFVICDEAHFFTSDAMFNPYTEKILHAITTTFQNAIRVYMTATPYECLGYIREREWKNVGASNLLYHFKRDYSYLNIKYYSHYDELEDIITESGKEKWLVFIDHIEEGKRYGRSLESLLEVIDEEKEDSVANSKVYVVHAGSKRESRYQRIVASERLEKDTKVLIATSVIDNGVNLRNVQNVVVSDVSIVKCVQMLGRARAERNERITLYIKRFDEKHLKKRIDQLENQRNAYYRHDRVRGNRNEELRFLDEYYNSKFDDWEDAKHWFGREEKEPAKLFPNEIARSLVVAQVSTYQAIRSEMTSDETSELPGQKYLEYQLSWFGHTYDVENDITLGDKNQGMGKLIAFLESHVNRELSKDEQDKFSEGFTGVHDAALPRRDKNKSRSYGINVINKALEEHGIGYKVESMSPKESGKSATCWVVVEINERLD